VAALDRNRLELFVLDLQVHALVDFVATTLIVGIDWLAGLFVDQLLTKAVPGFLVDLPESDSLARRGRRVERDWARNEGKLEKTFPVRARRGHRNSYANADNGPLITREGHLS
jgi:hypothetical protein